MSCIWSCETYLVDRSHCSHVDEKGKQCLLVRNTCACARQLVLSGLDWLPATSLPKGAVRRLHFALVLPQLERLPRTEATIPQSEAIISSVRISGRLQRGARNLLRARLNANHLSVSACVHWLLLDPRSCHVEAKRSVCKDIYMLEYQTLFQGQKIDLGKQALNHQSLALHEY